MTLNKEKKTGYTFLNYKNKQKEVAYNSLYILFNAHFSTGRVNFQQGSAYQIKLLTSKPKAGSLEQGF